MQVLGASEGTDRFMNKQAEKILQVHQISKSFYGNTVLDAVSFEMDYGQVLGLVGQNGAGKSTLVKILTGAYTRDSGSIKIEGREADLSSIHAANRAGIALVFQELSLASNMSVADNIFVGDWPTGKLNLVDKDDLYKRTQALIDEFDVGIRPEDKVGDLAAGKRQIVEILKALSKDPKVLILDEPTSSLEEGEIQILFQFIRRLKERGFSIIYISHHMSEIFDIVDTLLVLRDGKKVLECPREDVDIQQLISVMIGESYESYRGSDTRVVGSAPMYTVEAFTKHPYFRNISFSIARGEVLGIAGIVGCGKTELCETLFGVRKADSGTAFIAEQRIDCSSPAACKDAGLLCLPENRKTQGLFLNDTVENNMIACILNRVKNGLFLNRARIRQVLDKYRQELHIKMNSGNQIIRFLSGGNQQKVLLAKCIADEPRVLIAMDPTRGIDVASKADIHKILHDLSDAGLSILVVTSELDELLTICDRILVMNGGQIVEEYKRQDFDEEKILLCMHKSVEELGA